MKQIVQIETFRDHGELALGVARPFLFRAIPVKFHAVLVRIAEIKCLAYAVVGRAIQRNLGFGQATQRVGQGCTGRIENGGVVEPRAAGRRGRATETFPGVQSDMVMITSGGDERGLRTVTLNEFEAEHTDIEVECALQVGDFEVDVANADTGIDGRNFCGHRRSIARDKKMAIRRCARRRDSAASI